MNTNSNRDSDCLDKNRVERGIKVMVVDDDRDQLNGLQSALTYYGFDVVLCENATEALLRSVTQEFDYILVDYRMPGMNGVELVKRLRRRYPSAVMIGMSGSERGEQFLKTGANDFIAKPFIPGELALVIDGRNILA